jgi:hypothetical protein
MRVLRRCALCLGWAAHAPGSEQPAPCTAKGHTLPAPLSVVRTHAQVYVLHIQAVRLRQPLIDLSPRTTSGQNDLAKQSTVSS